MTELHNNIFSNTTCISKETMLKYINKQLSEEELYGVEKHMIDCDLCTEAIEGMRFAENSSVLFAMDHEIDQRANKGMAKTSLIRNLMVAASILIIVSGTYFTYNLYDSSFLDEGLALHNKVETTEKIVDEENFILPITDKTTVSEKEIEQKNVANSPSINEPVDESNTIKLPAIKPIEDGFKSEDIEEVVMADKVVSDDIIEIEEPLAFEIEEEFDDMAMSNEVETAANSLKTEDNGLLQNQESINKAKKSSVKKKSLATNRISTFDVSKENTKYIEDYKVVDYLVEYQNAEDLREATLSKSVPPNFSTKEDKTRADKEREESIIKVTYQKTLETGIHYFKLEKYDEALIQFNLILVKHPEDVNGLFYGGLSYFHLSQYEKSISMLDMVLQNKATVFNQEAKWYKALTLVALQDKRKAKKVLQEIIDEGGFYKTKAEMKLNEI